MAKLYYRYGAMNSGKTRDLIKTWYNYRERDMNAIIIKPVVDTKGKDMVISRDSACIKPDYLIKDIDNIYDIISKYITNNPLNCILVDEAQFLTRKHIDELSDIVDIHNIPVICYGLRSDYVTNLFEGSIRLFEIADSIEEMKTICKCGKKAIINLRYKDNEVVLDGDKISIDNEDGISYISYCRACAKEIIKKKKGDDNE